MPCADPAAAEHLELPWPDLLTWLSRNVQPQSAAAGILKL